MTRPGLLTTCRKIFHVVGSKYDGKCSEQVHSLDFVIKMCIMYIFCIGHAESCTQVLGEV